MLNKLIITEGISRNQRLILRLLKYSMTIRYVPGTRLVYTLSRSYDPNNTGSSTEEDIAVHVNMVVNSVPTSDTKSQEIIEETIKDPAMKSLRRVISIGWPETRDKCPLLSW